MYKYVSGAASEKLKAVAVLKFPSLANLIPSFSLPPLLMSSLFPRLKRLPWLI